MRIAKIVKRCFSLIFVCIMAISLPPYKAGAGQWNDAFDSPSNNSRSSGGWQDDAEAERYRGSADRPAGTGSFERDNYRPRSVQEQEPDPAPSDSPNETATTTSDSASSPAAEPAALAEDLLVLLKAPELVVNTSEQSIEFLLKNSPDTEGYSEIFREFGKRYLTWDNLKKAMIESYTDIFSAEELEELKKFFSSDAGRKYVAKNQDLLQKTSNAINDKILACREDLQRMIAEEELKKFNQQN